ncbi:hypothetical protein ZWY2020_045461 [Hordeum vulgare]|nr:hypothetical protein ZWY2020_045461 [Hordeum vulgare]
MVACAERLGVPRGSGMLRVALQAVTFLSEEKIAAKVDHLKKAFSWSDAEVVAALSMAPKLLKRSKDTLRRRFEFLVSEVGLEPGYIVHRPPRGTAAQLQSWRTYLHWRLGSVGLVPAILVRPDKEQPLGEERGNLVVQALGERTARAWELGDAVPYDEVAVGELERGENKMKKKLKEIQGKRRGKDTFYSGKLLHPGDDTRYGSTSTSQCRAACSNDSSAGWQAQRAPAPTQYQIRLT